jgi:hypothetical protein
MTEVITWVVDCRDGEFIERGCPSNAIDLMMNNPDLYSLTFNTDQNETTDGSENTGGSDLSLATAIANQTPSEVLGVELTRHKNSSPEQDLEASQAISDNHTPSGGQNGTYRKYREYREDGRGALPSDDDQSDEVTKVATRTYVDENGNTVTVTIRTTISNASSQGGENSEVDGGSINTEQDPLASPESRTTVTKTYVDENGETVTETLVYRNGDLVESSTTSGSDEGTEGVPGQQNSDADSNDVVIGIEPFYIDSVSNDTEAITVPLEPVAVGGKDQNDLILNYSAFDGASMIETYEANHVDAYSQQYTSASVIEAPGNEMNYMLDASQISRSTTDESENLMLAAMMTVETVGL